MCESLKLFVGYFFHTNASLNEFILVLNYDVF